MAEQIGEHAHAIAVKSGADRTHRVAALANGVVEGVSTSSTKISKMALTAPSFSGEPVGKSPGDMISSAYSFTFSPVRQER